MAQTSNTISAADRTRHVKYAIRDLVVLADQVKHQGREMLYLNIGDPIKFDFRTPAHLVEAVHQGMLAGQTGYGPSQGVEEAVSAIERESRKRGILEIIQICVTTGASEGIELALTSLVNPGENVLLPTPGYPLYSSVLTKLGAEVNPYYLDEDNEWQPDVADIESKINDKTKALVVINPNNPTGSIASEKTLRDIVALARKNNLLIFADEIYDKILLSDVEHVPLASVAQDHPCITFNGLSKSYLSPGLRIGWAIISGDKERSKDFVDGFMKMARARLCPNTPMQWAIKAALTGDHTHLSDMIERLKKRTALVVSRLNSIKGFHCVPPRGAFYVFPTISPAESDWDFVVELLRKTGVVTVPGSGFGQRPGTKHMRIVTLPPEEILSKAMDCIEEFAAGR